MRYTSAGGKENSGGSFLYNWRPITDPHKKSEEMLHKRKKKSEIEFVVQW
jgi:hypothetical protein